MFRLGQELISCIKVSQLGLPRFIPCALAVLDCRKHGDVFLYVSSMITVIMMMIIIRRSYPIKKIVE